MSKKHPTAGRPVARDPLTGRFLRVNAGKPRPATAAAPSAKGAKAPARKQ